MWISVVTLIPIVTSWIRSGRGYEERWFFAILGLVVAVMTIMLQQKLRPEDGCGIFSCRPIWKDPVLYLAAVFMALLLVQWFNAGRNLVLIDGKGWIYGPPPYPGWPSAIERGEASQMICWFLPAWISILAIRHWRWTGRALIGVMFVLLLNAGFLSILGILQFISGTSNQFWFHYLPSYFFSSFGYPNHAAAFFVLNFCLGCALFFRALYDGYTGLIKWMSLICLLLSYAGAMLSLSRTGIVMAFVAMFFAIGYAVIWLVKRGTPVQKLNGILGGAALLILAMAFVYSLAGDQIGVELGRTYSELSITRIVDPPVRSLTGIRYPFWKAAIGIWKDYPVFGCGGWGFRYLRKIYIPRDQWKTCKGYANVHNDPLNYLVEFGAVGFSCLFGTVLIIAYPIIRQGRYIFRNPFILFSTLGLGCVAVHSIIDLPFRCPANLYYWLILLALVGEGCTRRYFGCKRGQRHDGTTG